MDAADEPAKGAKSADQGAKPDSQPCAPDKARRDKALDDLMAELFFELDSAENEAPRSWLQLERRRTKRSS